MQLVGHSEEMSVVMDAAYCLAHLSTGILANTRVSDQVSFYLLQQYLEGVL